MTAPISIAKFETMESSLNRARGALKLARDNQEAVTTRAPFVGGALIAGYIDGKAGQKGAAVLPAALAFAAGWWMEMPWLMDMGAGALAPTAYDIGQALGSGQGLSMPSMPTLFGAAKTTTEEQQKAAA